MVKYNIAVVGATGRVGHAIFESLIERGFPYGEVAALASKNSINKRVSFGNTTLKVQSLEDFDFRETHIAIFAVSSEISKKYIPLAVDSGAVVIDKSSHYRLVPGIPLVIPEVNPHLLNELPTRRIIASPNCCVIPLVIALNPLNNAAKIKRIVVSTYQSVSGKGREAMNELYQQTKAAYMYQEPNPQIFEKQIAFNVIPKIEDFNDDGETGEEEKIRLETQKILGKSIGVSATAVRVPVFIGHSLSVNVEFNSHLSAKEAQEILLEADGVNFIGLDSAMQYSTPKEVVGEDNVFVSRVRLDPSLGNALNMWLVADNLKKGAALNAIQIAELIIEKL